MVYQPDKYPRLWMRVVKITLSGKSGTLEIDYDNPNMGDNTQKGIDCYFRVTVSDTADANKCDIEVHNLARDHRKMLTQNMTCTIFAGYKYGEQDVIFVGKSTIVYTVEGGTDVCTYIKCIDSSSDAINTHFQQETYKKDTPFVSIVRDQIRKSNLLIGDIRDPAEEYPDREFKLEKDETKTQTPWNVIWDMVSRTNGIIHSGQYRTTFEKDWQQKETPDGAKTDRYKSWTFYVTVKDGVSYGNFVDRRWYDGVMILLDAESGLIEVHPDDYVELSKGWTVKCLLTPKLRVGNNIKVVPKYNWPAMILNVREYTHEHADGGIYYTTIKAQPFSGG